MSGTGFVDSGLRFRGEGTCLDSCKRYRTPARLLGAQKAMLARTRAEGGAGGVRKP